MRKMIYNERFIRSGLKKGNSVLLPSMDNASETVEIKTEEELDNYILKAKQIKEFLEKDKNSKSAGSIFENALYAYTSTLTGPANSTIAGKLLSGKEINSSKIYTSGNVIQSKSAIKGAVRTYHAVEGGEIELPRVKRTSQQVMSLLKNEVEGYFVPRINKDGLVVTKGYGMDHFDVDFVAVSSKDITKEQLVEYFKAPFGDAVSSTRLNAYINFIISLCSEAYGEMSKNNETYNTVRAIVENCMEIYPLSFVKMQTPEPKPRKVVPPHIDPPHIDPSDDPSDDPERPIYGVRNYPNSRVKVDGPDITEYVYKNGRREIERKPGQRFASTLRVKDIFAPEKE